MHLQQQEEDNFAVEPDRWAVVPALERELALVLAAAEELVVVAVVEAVLDSNLVESHSSVVGLVDMDFEPMDSCWAALDNLYWDTDLAHIAEVVVGVHK